MPAVESQMLPLGTQAPAFSLPDPDGTLHSLREDAPATLVMFICNHCPFVVHVRSELARLGSDYGARGVAIYAINSNDVKSHPADHPRHIKEEAAGNGYTCAPRLMPCLRRRSQPQNKRQALAAVSSGP